jgi:3-hydroxyacyl-CoA dehydrogenase
MLSRLNSRASQVRAFAARQLHTDKTVAVVGLGSMGHGVAQLCATSGYKVIAVEHNQQFLDGGVGAIEKSVKQIAKKAVAKGKQTQEEADAHVAATLGRITGTIDLNDVADADLVIEAIIEDMDVKIDFYTKLGAICKPETIFATNTSSYSVTEMANVCGRPNLMCGLHYFNPVQIMKLVEVASTTHTDEAVVDCMYDFVKNTNKVPVRCGDTPGFIVNRLLVPYLTEAVAMVERGDATPEDIDTAMMLGAGHPMGPITLSDYVGNEINLACMQGWMKRFPENPSFKIPEGVKLLGEMADAGKRGRKDGQGFYKWDGNKKL